TAFDPRSTRASRRCSPSRRRRFPPARWSIPAICGRRASGGAKRRSSCSGTRPHVSISRSRRRSPRWAHGTLPVRTIRDDGSGRWPTYRLQYRFHQSWWIASSGVNWTVGERNFNEFRYGVQHSGDTTPGRGIEFYQANGTLNGQPLRFAPNGATPGLPFGLSQMVQDAAPITGRHYITTIYDTLTLLRGDHSMKVGGTFRLTDWHDTSFDGPGGIQGINGYSIGSPAGDPVQSIFNATTMPGVQGTDQASAYSLYALLTGQLTRIRTARQPEHAAVRRRRP